MANGNGQEITKMSKWQTPHGEVAATPEILRKLFKAPNASDFEVFTFIQLCKAQGLNPFLRDAYLIKYGNNPATIVTGKETFTQRAESHPQFDGMEAGIIVDRDGDVRYFKGTFHLPTDTLLGGWARVHRKDRSVPLEKSVAFSEYDTGKSLWKTKPATMIEKVPIVQALREAFPQTFAGLYDSSEIGQDLPRNEEAPPPVELPREDVSVIAPDEASNAAEPEKPQGFLNWLESQDKTTEDVKAIIGADATRENVRQYQEQHGLKTTQALYDHLVEEWERADIISVEEQTPMEGIPEPAPVPAPH